MLVMAAAIWRFSRFDSDSIAIGLAQSSEGSVDCKVRGSELTGGEQGHGGKSEFGEMHFVWRFGRVGKRESSSVFWKVSCW
jgi:hypothetical protein